MTTASTRSSTISFQVSVSLSAVPLMRKRTPSGRPPASSGAMTSSSINSIACCNGIESAGVTRKVMVRTRSERRISVGPLVTATRARLSTGTTRPSRVTTGSAPISWVWPISSTGPIKVRSMRLPSTVISETRNPSLKASTD